MEPSLDHGQDQGGRAEMAVCPRFPDRQGLVSAPPRAAFAIDPVTNGLVLSAHSNGSSSPSQGQRAPCIRPTALENARPH